jgi:hypothetical protein
MKKLLLFSLFLIMASGCGIPIGAGAVPMGILYTDATGPLSATGSGVGSKKGEACASGILGLVSTGDASVATAARSGGISRISTVSYQYTTILGVYTKTCAVVTGD